MKAILVGIGVAASVLVARTGPDYGKLLDEAKYSLSEAIDKGLKEAKEGTVVKAEIEREKGKIIFTMDVAQGDKILEVGLDVKEGRLVSRDTESEDQSALVKASKITLKQAIEAALKKVDGKAVVAELTLKDNKPGALVKVFSNGKVSRVLIDGETGKALRVEEEKKEEKEEKDEDD